MKGFFNRVLHIDLTASNYWIESLPDSVFASWLGGRGLGCYLLYKNLKPGVDPLLADNVIIFATGPATGTRMLSSSRYGVYSKSPLTGFFADSYAGGNTALAMKSTGYDAFVIHGSSSSPVFLEVSPDAVKFRDASGLWGKSTYETEDECLKRVNVPGARALVIGPAGENLVRFACIVNNHWRNAGRTGMGAVMGSKKLKAVVFHGDREAEIADAGLLETLINELNEKSKTDLSVKKYREPGTPMLVAMANLASAFPTGYWSSGSIEGWENISADAMLKNFEVKPKSCPRCFYACGKQTTVKAGRHAGLTIEGPEYETIYSFGGLCKIMDLAEIAYFNDICDRQGIDTITAGNLVALCMELSKRGRLSPKIEYGSADQVAELLNLISKREGLGKILADGIKNASSVLDAGDLAIHVKGLEPAGYDPRTLKGMALGYAVSPRGACHLPATFYIYELRGVMKPSETKGKAELFINHEDRLTIMDTLIQCRFLRDMLDWDRLATIIKATTGLNYDQSRLREIAQNISTLRRWINIREGLTKEDDMLPQRLFNEANASNGAKITKEELVYMVDDYYQLRGWDKLGIPLKGPAIDYY